MTRHRPLFHKGHLVSPFVESPRTARASHTPGDGLSQVALEVATQTALLPSYPRLARRVLPLPGGLGTPSRPPPPHRTGDTDDGVHAGELGLPRDKEMPWLFQADWMESLVDRPLPHAHMPTHARGHACTPTHRDLRSTDPGPLHTRVGSRGEEGVSSCSSCRAWSGCCRPRSTRRGSRSRRRKRRTASSSSSSSRPRARAAPPTPTHPGGGEHLPSFPPTSKRWVMNVEAGVPLRLPGKTREVRVERRMVEVGGSCAPGTVARRAAVPVQGPIRRPRLVFGETTPTRLLAGDTTRDRLVPGDINEDSGP